MITPALDKKINELISEKTDKSKLASQLGFFSKPVRTTVDEIEYVIKLYKPVKNQKTVDLIFDNHDKYVEALRSTGIKIPDTILEKKNIGGKTFLVIIQQAYKPEELTRGIVESGEKEKVIEVLRLLLDECFLFWKNKPIGNNLGFHPTTRNYALTQNGLEYFDTFPPMMMDQKELNRIILQMAPTKINVSGIIPLNMVSRVSDEYYMIDKMIAGIVGSSCRLRPELQQDILDFARIYVNATAVLSEEEKGGVLILLNKPPQLSGLWISIRKFFGKPGKPNLKS